MNKGDKTSGHSSQSPSENHTMPDKIMDTVDDMSVVSDFLNFKGRFVGDMVHIGIKDLAGQIHKALEAKQPEPIKHNGKTYWPDANGWYDIECAPYDRFILLAVDSCVVKPKIDYVQGRRHSNGYKNGKWVTTQNDYLTDIYIGEVYAWQPLPKPPESEEV